MNEERRHNDTIFQKVAAKTPTIVRLDIPGMRANLIAYADVDSMGNDAHPTMLQINDRFFFVAGPCGGASKVYKLGKNYFIMGTSMYCETDVIFNYVLRILPSGVKTEVDLPL